MTPNHEIITYETTAQQPEHTHSEERQNQGFLADS